MMLVCLDSWQSSELAIDGTTANDRTYALAASVLSSGRKYCVPLNYVTLIGVEAFQQPRSILIAVACSSRSPATLQCKYPHRAWQPQDASRPGERPSCLP